MSAPVRDLGYVVHEHPDLDQVEDLIKLFQTW
jgi:hypothetical protein